MFPQLQDNHLLEQQGEQTPVPWTYRFDWETKQFRQGPDGRYLRTSSYAEYLEETAKKILNTKRFRYAIYSERYGVDYLYDIGVMRSAISLPAIKREAEEALEAHAEIERAEVQDIRLVGNRVVCAVVIEGVRGTTTVEVDVWQR